MSTENTIADRLLDEARKKTARSESPTLGKAAFVVGVIALLVSWISILGWIVGATAVGLGAAAVRRPVSERRGKIAMAMGGGAILIGVFFYTLNLAMR
jgi:hypothetical protein